MRVTVRLFARLRDIAGTGELTRDAPAGANVASVWSSLVAEYPELSAYEKSISCAVNADYSRFSAAVAGFGLVLRESVHRGQATLPEVLTWAQGSLGDDHAGFRQEFVQVVRQAMDVRGG